MPTYQYRCTECGHDLEAVQKFSDAALTQCPNCRGQLRKIFNAVGVVFKGSGFYRTDSRKSGNGSDSGSDSSPANGNGSGIKETAATSTTSSDTGSSSGSGGSGSGGSGSGGSDSGGSGSGGSGSSKASDSAKKSVPSGSSTGAKATSS